MPMITQKLNARRHGIILAASAAVFATSFASFYASAQQGPPRPPPIPGTETYLIRQDFSDCQNGNVSAKDPSLIGGTVWVLRNQDGTTSVKVAMTAKADTTYHFFLKCVRQLGDIKTGDEGIGEGAFSFATNSTGAIVTFDMYPEGAPAGNKYQSVQITMH